MDNCIDHGKKGLSKLPYALKRHLGKCEYIHRVVFAESNGLSIEDIRGWHICHTCDNPRCINPAHLFVSDNAGNMRDKALKRRAPGKLSDEQVIAIRNTVFSKDVTQVSVARLYGVDPSHISRILSGHHGKYAEERMGLSH